MDAPVSNPAHAALHARIRHLFTADPFSAPLAIRLIEVAPGWALLAMEVGRGQVNAHGGCHGGALWTLADMAFGAAGYYDGPILTVGSDLTFLRPAPAGSIVHASARQISRKGLTGLFQIVLSMHLDDPDAVVAAGSFTGRWVRPPEQAGELQTP